MSEWSSDLFEDLYAHMRRQIARPLWNATDSCLEPLVEIEDQEHGVVLLVDLPCVAKKEDVAIQASEDKVDLKAKMSRGLQWERWGTVQRRVSFTEFRKIIQLPSRVKPDESKASFKNGILRLWLPKATKMFPIELE